MAAGAGFLCRGQRIPTPHVWRRRDYAAPRGHARVLDPRASGERRGSDGSVASGIDPIPSPAVPHCNTLPESGPVRAGPESAHGWSEFQHRTDNRPGPQRDSLGWSEPEQYSAFQVQQPNRSRRLSFVQSCFPRVVEERKLVESWQETHEVLAAARPSRPDTLLRDVMAAAQNARLDALDMQLRGRQADVPDANPEARLCSLQQATRCRAASQCRLERVADL